MRSFVQTIYDKSAGEAAAAAVIVAAGSFSRMGGIPKQRAPLLGRPVIAHTIAAFQQAESIGEIVLVVREEDRTFAEKVCKDNTFTKVKAITPGGSTRQESVLAGIGCVSEKAAYYAVHDGARPLITPSVINAVVKAAKHYQAAAAAVRVKDTVKIADEDGFIRSTPERRALWNVQTPQVFERGLYRRAVKAASERGLNFTDDCQLVERLGGRVYLVEADYTNMKITTPEDLCLAEALLRRREENAQ